jgi:hypothetical protein
MRCAAARGSAYHSLLQASFRLSATTYTHVTIPPQYENESYTMNAETNAYCEGGSGEEIGIYHGRDILFSSTSRRRD